MARYINGVETTAYCFAFDGCHKFYLIDNEKQRRELEDCGYDIYRIKDLPIAWVDSCPLRFIMSADLTRQYVPQFEPAHFRGWNVSPYLQRQLDWLEEDQRTANGELQEAQ